MDIRCPSAGRGRTQHDQLLFTAEVGQDAADPASHFIFILPRPDDGWHCGADHILGLDRLADKDKLVFALHCLNSIDEISGFDDLDPEEMLFQVGIERGMHRAEANHADFLIFAGLDDFHCFFGIQVIGVTATGSAAG